MIALVTLLLYLAISLALTIWVGRTLHRNGRIFVIDAFHGDADRGDAVNHLLLVGFHLINIGFVALFLRFGDRPEDLTGALEYLTTKVGVVLLVLGGMHFFNMWNLNKLRRKARPEATPGGRRDAGLAAADRL